jgi:O-acetyl-ADP-ribose deacetylase (regulator of RNase III)
MPCAALAYIVLRYRIYSYHKLFACVTSCLQTADNLFLDSLALPAIGTGANGFTNELASRAIVAAVAHFFTINSESRWMLYDVALISPRFPCHSATGFPTSVC